jgi:hypothetical protein
VCLPLGVHDGPYVDINTLYFSFSPGPGARTHLARKLARVVQEAETSVIYHFKREDQIRCRLH